MVAKLPDQRVLGPSPNIGVNGLTPKLSVANWSSGDAMLASGLDSLGRGIAGVGAGFQAQQDKADTLAEAAASADFSIAKDNSYTKLSTDPDYEKAPQTYREESTKALQDNAAKITDPYKRQMFIERGRVGIETNANNLQQRGVILKNQQTILDNDGRLNELAAQGLANPDETYRAQKLEEAQKILRSELDNRLITPKEYRARNKAFIEKYGESFGTDLINRDPAKALEQLDKIVPREAPVGPQSGNPSVDTIFSAIHQQESGGGRNTSTSVTGARGDMQIQPGTWAQYAKPGEDINNSTDNKAVGKRIIADLYEKAGGDPARVAVGYFSGPGNIAPAGSPTPWKADRADPAGKTVSSYVSDVTGRLKTSAANSSPVGSSDNVIESQSGAVRSQPIAPSLKNQLQYAASQAGVTLEITSGGQSETGPFRVGSTRHDNGNAADVVVRDGQTGRLLDHTDPKDQAVFAKLVQSAAQAGITGVGAGPGYMNNNSIHLGGGVDAVWGAKGSKDAAPSWLRTAYAEGRKSEPVALDEQQPEKVRLASLGGGTVSDASGAPAKEPQGVQVAQAQTGTPLDFLRPDQIVRLRQKAQQAIEKQERDAIKQSAIRGEEYERRMLDAAAGKGDLPTREEIEADTSLHITHKNTVLRQWAQHSKETIAMNAAFQRFRAGDTFNPYEKDDRTNADLIFKGLGGDDAALTTVLQRTGIMPESAATKMRGDLISNDPKRVVGAMTRAANAISINQNAMTGFSGADDLEKNAVKFRTFVDDFGMKAEDAANRMIREQTPEFKASVNAKLKNENVDELIKKKVTVDDLAGQFDDSFLGLARNPKVGFSVRTRDAMFDQFASLTKEHYLDMAAGDIGVAKKLAARDLKKTWGTSSVNGSSVVMQYPPERAPVYQGIEKASDLIAKEAVKTIKEETGQDANQKTLRIVPIPGVTAQAYKSGQVPPYALSWEDKNGVLQMLRPGRAFVADPSAMRQQQTTDREIEFNKGREAAQAERMIQRDQRVPFGVPQ